MTQLISCRVRQRQSARPATDRISNGVAALELSEAAVSALLEEAELTPKPALVDRRGNGAHHDLDLDRLRRSARSLQDGFADMARAAAVEKSPLRLREQIGQIGRDMERRMLGTTGGSNAHRGAIWVLGLLVAARALPGAAEVGAIAARAARLARLPDRHAPPSRSNGARACRRFGVTGARGEAAAGFPHVTRIGLPALHSTRRRGRDESCARLDALLAIMTSLEDTCLLHRGGWAALSTAQQGARAVLALGGSATSAGRQALLALDAELVRRCASPGGCADLLAACLFLDDLPLREASPWSF
jgi:triphosphoribosyl-dephospho-CoA synthase